jgi:hypothetical protein
VAFEQRAVMAPCVPIFFSIPGSFSNDHIRYNSLCCDDNMLDTNVLGMWNSLQERFSGKGR